MSPYLEPFIVASPILRLALPSPLRRLFDYLPPAGVPLHLLKPGMRLQVPFGNRQMVGVLIDIAARSNVPAEKLKPAQQLLDSEPLLNGHLLEFCHWTAQYYHHSLGDTLFWALPALLRQGEPAQRRKQRFWHAKPDADELDLRLKRAPRQRQALHILKQHPHGIAHELLGQLGINKDSLNLLREKGLVELEVRERIATSTPRPWLAQPELPLNSEQQIACEAVAASLSQFRCFLLAGVTGSGKTEVYLQLIHRVLKAGRQVLVLIPEINLGPQTVDRFEQRFNARIALLHSGLNDRERLEAWLAARTGEADIVIGTRSAIFTPLCRAGLIIVDEEHDASYKQQEGLRYHARDLAVIRARMENVPLLLGSATPSLESLHNSHIGRYGLLRLTQRAGEAQPPAFVRLDIKSMPLEDGLSRPLQQALSDTLREGHQALVFLNRRGFAPTLLCHDCGWISQCPRCDARMTFHQRSHELRCHHCDHRQPPPLNCPNCQRRDLRPVGAGTERAEDRLQRLFPEYPVWRIDRDSTARKSAMQQIFDTVQQGAPCVLVGTQMLAKGHHFPKVTLVAILDADGGLFSSDFRAVERMAQLITQVAGRAGRAENPGKVLIQTHLADHPLLVQLTEQGYFAFAEQALSERRAAMLPPFSHLALLRAEAHSPQHAEQFLDRALEIAHGLLSESPANAVELFGPVPAPMEKRAGKFRAQLLLQSTRRSALHGLLAPLLEALDSQPGSRQVRWSIDVDPIDLL